MDHSAGQIGKRLRRRCDDRGVAVLEGALVLPVFILIVLGMLEGGRLLLLNQTIRAASSTAVRQASIQGNDLSSDYRVLQAIKRSTQGRIPASQIERIVIFEATIPGQPNDFETEVPEDCLTGPVNGTCNVYTGADFNLTEAQLSTCNSPSKSRFWCAADRKYASLSTDGNGPPDWIGVYIEGDLPSITGFFGDSVTLSDTLVGKIESTSLR